MSRPSIFLSSIIQGLKRPSARILRANTLSKPQFRTKAPCQKNAPPIEPQFTQFSDAQRIRRIRNLRRLFWIVLFGGIGYVGTLSVSAVVNRPVIEPDSPEDVEAQKRLQAKFDQLEIVQKLREDLEYVEWEAYGNFSPEEKDKRLTSGALKGTRGISMQRVFYNESKNTATTVLHLGSGTEGWPRVVHGGALGIILDESLGRVAIRFLPARTAVTANLNINYRQLSSSGRFYTVTATCDANRSTDRKAIVRGEIRNEKGELCVEATGLFVVPKTLQLRKLGDEF